MQRVIFKTWYGSLIIKYQGSALSASQTPPVRASSLRRSSYLLGGVLIIWVLIVISVICIIVKELIKLVYISIFVFKYNQEKIEKEIKLDNKIYKIIDFQIVTFHELLRLIDSSTVYMNKPSCYNIFELLDDEKIRNKHKIKEYFSKYLLKDYDLNSDTKDILLIKIDKGNKNGN